MSSRRSGDATAPRPARLGWVAFFLWLAAVGALPRSSSAQEQDRISAVLAGDPEVVEKIVTVLRGSLDRQGLNLVAVRAAQIDPLDVARFPLDRAPGGPVANLWLDLASDHPAMYLLDARSGLVYVRQMAVRADPDAVEIELIRLVVDSSVESILKGRVLGVSRDEFERSLTPSPGTTPPTPPPPTRASPPPPTPTPTPTPAPLPTPPRPPRRAAPATPLAAAPQAATSRRAEWAIAAGYSGTMLATNFLAHGPELGAERRWPQIRLGMTVSQQFQQAVTLADVATHLDSTAIRFYALSARAITSDLSVSFGVGAGVDATRVAPTGAGAKPSFWATDPMLLAMADLAHSFGQAFVSARVGVEYDLVAPRYLIASDDGTRVLWSPSRWRPLAALRLGLTF